MNTEFELMQSEIANDLVPVNETDALKIADSLLDTRRYCRPWTRDFLQDLSQAYYEAFHTPLQVNSLVRTADQQVYLRRHNRFAAPAFGDTASTHLAGVSVDLSRRGLTATQYKWIRGYLQPLQEKGMVDPIEERQPVLHIVVFEKYSGRRSHAAIRSCEATELDLLESGGASRKGSASSSATPFHFIPNNSRRDLLVCDHVDFATSHFPAVITRQGWGDVVLRFVASS
jgi:hypothetical protein